MDPSIIRYIYRNKHFSKQVFSFTVYTVLFLPLWCKVLVEPSKVPNRLVKELLEIRWSSLSLGVLYVRWKLWPSWWWKLSFPCESGLEYLRILTRNFFHLLKYNHAWYLQLSEDLVSSEIKANQKLRTANDDLLSSYLCTADSFTTLSIMLLHFHLKKSVVQYFTFCWTLRVIHDCL